MKDEKQTLEFNEMKTNSYVSVVGKTGKIRIEEETYLIICDNRREKGFAIDIDFKNNLIRVSSNDKWKIHPMTADLQAQEIEVLDDSMAFLKI